MSSCVEKKVSFDEFVKVNEIEDCSETFIDNEDQIEMFNEVGPLAIRMILLTDSKDTYSNRLYGPMCHVIGTVCEYSSDDKCRMLECLCNCGESDDWFTGCCENKECDNTIEHRCTAVRFPLPQGGWDSFCFCSIQCMEEYYGADGAYNATIFSILRQRLEQDPIDYVTILENEIKENECF